MSRAVSLLPLCALMAWTGKALPAPFIIIRSVGSTGLMILKILVSQTKMVEHQ